jgi:DNA replication protein DnaC
MVESEQDKKELEFRAEQQRNIWRREANLPPKYLSKTFDNFKSERQPKAYEATKQYAGRSVVLFSPAGEKGYGIGKTHLVCALANHLIATKEAAYFDKHGIIQVNPCPVYFTNEPDLMGRIRETYNGGSPTSKYYETEESIYRSLDKFPLLIIDDVGKNRPRDLSFIQGVYYRIINRRYDTEKPTVLTTNLIADEIEEHIGGACADRLIEMCGKQGLIKMAGASFRGQK